MVAKKSGSAIATRSTGICSRANHTRTLAGMRSSVSRLWNISATISMVARSTGVVAACLSATLRLCSSCSSPGADTATACDSTGTPEAAPAAEAPPSKRRRTACSASLIAALSPGEG